MIDKYLEDIANQVLIERKALRQSPTFLFLRQPKRLHTHRCRHFYLMTSIR